MRLFRRKRKTSSGSAWELARPLISWGDEERRYDIGASFEGTFIAGASGSGKTSGPGEEIALAFLRAGYGGIVHSAKDERRLWERYARLAGRERDLLIIGPDLRYRFNFLDYEASRSGKGAGLVENLVSLFMIITELANRDEAGNSSGGDDGRFWDRSLKQLLRNTIQLLLLAGRPVSVPDIHRLVVSAPASREQLISEEWKQHSFCYRCLKAAEATKKSDREQKDFDLTVDFWLSEFPGLAPKTRSIVISSLTAASDCLSRGLLADLLCSDTNITPEAVEDGRVLLLDLPFLQYNDLARIFQGTFKYCFQRHIERRNVEKSPRPVFLWSDEFQHVVTSHDQLFLTTCRSARVATVLISQSLSVIHAALGGTEKAKCETASLLTNLSSKFFCANSCEVTNHFAAGLAGRTLQTFGSGGSSKSNDRDWMYVSMGLQPDGQSNAGFSESFESDLQHSDFANLRTGGPRNGFLVDALLFSNGQPFGTTGKNWMKVTFDQRRGEKS